MCKVFSGFLPSEGIDKLQLPNFTGWTRKIRFICFSTASAQARGKTAARSVRAQLRGGRLPLSPGHRARRDRGGTRAFGGEECHICPHLAYQEAERVGSAGISRASKHFVG